MPHGNMLTALTQLQGISDASCSPPPVSEELEMRRQLNGQKTI